MLLIHTGTKLHQMRVDRWRECCEKNGAQTAAARAKNAATAKVRSAKAKAQAKT